MNRSSVRHRFSTLVAAILLFAVVGCNPSKEEDTSIANPPDLANNQDSAANLHRQAAAGQTNAVGDSQPHTPAPIPANQPAGDRQSSTEMTNARPQQGEQPPNFFNELGDAPMAPATQPNVAGPTTEQPKSASPFTVAASNVGNSDTKAPRLELRSDLSPAELSRFLTGADTDMQLILSGRSGITNQRDAMVEMNRIAKLKLEASKRLRNHADSDDRAKSEGARGELQALSHLASQGDLKSADALEALATQNLESDDVRLVADSRIVLVGFAIEALQAGKKDASDRVVTLVNQIESDDTQPDVPAMMIMGHARELLARYGHNEQSAQVRKRIIDLYSNSSDPEIARLAAQVAGNVQFDAIEALRASAVKGEAVTVEQWQKAANTLVDEAGDILTVQYLAGSALELEATKNISLANATYGVLSKRFEGDSTAASREAQAALHARAARASVIGSELPTDLPAIDGAPLLISTYRDKVVLMPFWASGFPDSLLMVPTLREIQKAHPDDVAIVGMNLDSSGAQLERFMKSGKLGFRSFHAASSPTNEVANPVVQKFGMVTMPFTAILDRNGRVAALDLGGLNLKNTVEELIKE